MAKPITNKKKLRKNKKPNKTRNGGTKKVVKTRKYRGKRRVLKGGGLVDGYVKTYCEDMISFINAGEMNYDDYREYSGKWEKENFVDKGKLRNLSIVFIFNDYIDDLITQNNKDINFSSTQKQFIKYSLVKKYTNVNGTGAEFFQGDSLNILCDVISKDGRREGFFTGSIDTSKNIEDGINNAKKECQRELVRRMYSKQYGFDSWVISSSDYFDTLKIACEYGLDYVAAFIVNKLIINNDIPINQANMSKMTDTDILKNALYPPKDIKIETIFGPPVPLSNYLYGLYLYKYKFDNNEYNKDKNVKITIIDTSIKGYFNNSVKSKINGSYGYISNLIDYLLGNYIYSTYTYPLSTTFAKKINTPDDIPRS